MTQTITNTPDIMDEYMRLSLMNTIDDPAAHAEEWRSLAINAALEDRIATAINCMTRVQYWQEQTPCVRLVEGSFSELIPTHKTDEEPGLYDWQARADMD